MTTSGSTRVAPAGPRLAARRADQRGRRRLARLRRIAFSALVLLPLLALGWLLTASPLLAVRRVVVTGESTLSAAQITAAAGVARGTPLARVDVARVARRVRALPPVLSVSVRRSWPHELRLVVRERTPVAQVRTRGTALLLDPAGVVVRAARSGAQDLVTLQVPAPDDPATRAALVVLGQLPPELRRQLAAVSATSPEQVQLMLRDGRQVVWGSAAGGRQKAAATVVLLRLPGRLFDVSAPGVVTRR